MVYCPSLLANQLLHDIAGSSGVVTATAHLDVANVTNQARRNVAAWQCLATALNAQHP